MTDRVVLGLQNDGSYGLRISPPGVSALTGALKDVSFSSDFAEYGVVHQTGELLVTVNNTEVLYPELPYVPCVIYCAQKQGDTDWWPYLWNGAVNPGYALYPHVNARLDRLVLRRALQDTNYVIRYVVLRMRARP